MKNKFIFLIQKTVSWYPRWKQKIKWVEVHAEDVKDAYNKIGINFSDWEVSMFWPKTDSKHNPKTIIN